MWIHLKRKWWMGWEKRIGKGIGCVGGGKEKGKGGRGKKGYGVVGEGKEKRKGEGRGKRGKEGISCGRWGKGEMGGGGGII